MARLQLYVVALQADELDNKLLGSIFNRKEFNITTFGKARDFLKYMKLQPAPDCMITDLDLSDEPGEQIIHKIRSDERWKDTPILVLAESVDKNTVRKLSKYRINGYVVKPFNPERLFNDTLRLMGVEVVTQKTKVKRVKAS
ncbi:PleD family two-component system response regulator [Pleionea sp. CnH1-48]|uniref:response regulator n=1 Tax=Pleionea sp. CnH1-48 TaxID=2954494 RepID=UPI00209747BA|nr:response regulator [Pleionea sp. CnH1-48]MCO7226440.1 response regulator [Pleionea sp. CnH1-48]